MLFSKLKPKSDELLPPPPPFPSMDLEEERHDVSEAKPKARQHKDEELEDLFKEVEGLKAKSPKKALAEKQPKIKAEPKLKALKKPAIKKEQKRLIKNIALPKAKPLKKPKAAVKLLKPSSKPKKEDLEEPDFLLPKDMSKDFGIPEIEKPEEIEMPDNLEDLDIDKEFGADLDQESGSERGLDAAKPREIEEAEDEIKSAIEKIKQTERPSMLKKIFGKKEAKKAESQPDPEVQNDVSSIQSRLNSARDALMRFDLEAAKRNYIEIMRIYNKIKPEEQAKVYHDVKDLYFERKSAEEMKI
ncbi:hypothetical protein HYX08_05465 [Candidatus Woesearchaeota archaeon]|nr:hypothetical protein [Candidatus Woesearchaeota archaeon]